MVKVTVSAPGKIILHGEHSVVYGHKALAASVNLRTTTQLTTIDDEIRIELPNLLVNEKFALIIFEKLFKVLDESDNCDILVDIEKIKNFFGFERSFSINAVNAISIIFYVYYWFLKNNNNAPILHGIQVMINSEFQIGSGLGSSASYMVSLVGAFLIYSKMQYEKIGISDVLVFSESDLKSINKMSLELEKVVHGRPSGIDNAVCTYGQILLYEKGEFSVLNLNLEHSLSIILVNSNVERNTKLLIESIAEFEKKHSNVIKSIFKSIDVIVNEVVAILSKSNFCNEYGKLGDLMEINHHLLQSIKASHPKLDEIFTYAKEFSFSGKLTGAGGGGYFIILVPLKFDESKKKALIKKLKDNGFESKEIQLSCDGVRIDSVF